MVEARVSIHACGRCRTYTTPALAQGLGKTAQSIATLEFQRQFLGIRGPHIVIAPLTTLGHWQREIETWTGMVRAPEQASWALVATPASACSFYKGSLQPHGLRLTCTCIGTLRSHKVM